MDERDYRSENQRGVLKTCNCKPFENKKEQKNCTEHCSMKRKHWKFHQFNRVLVLDTDKQKLESRLAPLLCYFFTLGSQLKSIAKTDCETSKVYATSCNLCLGVAQKGAVHYHIISLKEACPTVLFGVQLVCLFFQPYRRSPSLWSFGSSLLTKGHIFINTNGTPAILGRLSLQLEAEGS